MATTTAPTPPWWLDAGPDGEPCPHCLGTYAYEVEVRCADCDGPGCPHCLVAVRERVGFYCPPCSASESDGEGAG